MAKDFDFHNATSKKFNVDASSSVIYAMVTTICLKGQEREIW